VLLRDDGAEGHQDCFLFRGMLNSHFHGGSWGRKCWISDAVGVISLKSEGSSANDSDRCNPAARSMSIIRL
jgi:hypothetical protein